MQQFLDFILNNPVLWLFVIMGILGNIGSSAANKKRKREQLERREERRRAAQDPRLERTQGGAGAGEPSGGEARRRQEDELSRRIREMLEGGPPAEARRPAPPAAQPKPVPPPPVPVAKKEDDRWLAEGFDLAFDSEKTAATEAAAKAYARRPKARIDATGDALGSIRQDFEDQLSDYVALEVEAGDDPFASSIGGGMGPSFSMAGLGDAVLDARPSAELPEGMSPRRAFEMMVALGPCRSNRSYDEEHAYLF